MSSTISTIMHDVIRVLFQLSWLQNLSFTQSYPDLERWFGRGLETLFKLQPQGLKLKLQSFKFNGIPHPKGYWSRPQCERYTVYGPEYPPLRNGSYLFLRSQTHCPDDRRTNLDCRGSTAETTCSTSQVWGIIFQSIFQAGFQPSTHPTCWGMMHRAAPFVGKPYILVMVWTVERISGMELVKDSSFLG